MRILWAIVVGLIAFIIAQWLITLVAAGLPDGHLLAVLIGLAAGIAHYYYGNWLGPRHV
jgi:uncharacterized membrane protein YeaQ/YmgE (transglycosylase-associated protein family)